MQSADAARVCGEADVAGTAWLFADAGRARILCALADGRALPATVLAAEAGVAASTASEHLARLVDGGLLVMERSGRHRYYRLANDRVAAVIESLSLLAPRRPIRSLRESTRMGALRRGRTCYDHLAGRLGVAVTDAFVRTEALVRTDGRAGVDRGPSDRLASPVMAAPYQLGPAAEPVFARLGVSVADVANSTRRPTLRFCVDWTEQQHHLAGALGAALLARLRAAGWVRSLPAPRAVTLTDAGRAALSRALPLSL